MLVGKKNREKTRKLQQCTIALQSKYPSTEPKCQISGIKIWQVEFMHTEKQISVHEEKQNANRENKHEWEQLITKTWTPDLMNSTGDHFHVRSLMRRSYFMLDH